MASLVLNRWLQRKTLFNLLRRVAVVLLVTIALSAILNRPTEKANPAGFRRGILDGALMPGALPPLLFGRDVTIYSPNNTGRTYKIGYTVGVNGCGALFFGIVFFRLTRWKKRRDMTQNDDGRISDAERNPNSIN